MSHYDRVPDLLANLVASPSIAEACRRTGMTPATHWNYLIRSKQSDPLFQEIEWHGVKAPYWQHVANTRMLSRSAAEPLLAQGAAWHESPGGVAQSCELVITGVTSEVLLIPSPVRPFQPRLRR
jgi:hypothetical protein